MKSKHFIFLLSLAYNICLLAAAPIPSTHNVVSITARSKQTAAIEKARLLLSTIAGAKNVQLLSSDVVMATIELPEEDSLPVGTSLADAKKASTSYQALLEQRYADIGYILAMLDKILRYRVSFPNKNAKTQILSFKSQYSRAENA